MPTEESKMPKVTTPDQNKWFYSSELNPGDTYMRYWALRGYANAQVSDRPLSIAP